VPRIGTGSGSNFLGGIVGQLGDAFVQARQEKAQRKLDEQKQLYDFYSKAIENGDLDPEVGYPLLQQILTGHYNELTGQPADGKGKGKGDQSFFGRIFGKEGMFSPFMIGAHKSLKDQQQVQPTGAAPGGADSELPQSIDARGGGTSLFDAKKSAATHGAPSDFDTARQAVRSADRTGREIGPGGIHWRTRKEKEDAEEAAYERKETFKSNEAIRVAKAEGRFAPKGRVQWVQGTTSGADIANAKDADGNPIKDIYNNEIDPKKSYKVGKDDAGQPIAVPVEKSAAGKDDKSPLGRLTKRFQVLNPGMSEEDAQKKAAQRMESDDTMTRAQRVGRYNAAMRASNNASNLSRERYKEMVELYPYHLTGAQNKEEMDAFKAAVAETKSPQGAQKALQSAERLAQSIVSKQSSLLRSLGLEEDRKSIEDGLLREAGLDPDEVRATASNAFEQPTPPTMRRTPPPAQRQAPPPGAITTPNGHFTPINPQ
jgi:hypothetical protein